MSRGRLITIEGVDGAGKTTLASALANTLSNRGFEVEEVKEINSFATGGLRPDRTLLLTLAPTVGRERLRSRAEPLDRLEAEDEEFFARIGSAYLELAERDPERVRVIDASGAPQQVLGAALEQLADLI